MSGFEIAGAVLGAIPLVISALESYKNGVLLIQRYRSYENEIQLLIRNINIERVRLQNVCEKLLDGLAPSSQIDAMVENPGGGLWMDEEIQKKIRARLWRSWDVFEQTLRDILVAITDISKRVGSGSDVRWSDTSLVWTELTSTAKKEFSSLLKKELKRAGFTLRRSTYEGLLATVEKDISKLESLASMDIKLEPKRRLRSRVRLLNILRSLSSSVYHAVFSSLTCACKHRISMRIPDYKDDLTPSHDDEYVIQKLQVHLTLSLPQSQLEESPSVVIDRQWEELIIRANPLLQTSIQTSNSVSDTGKTIVSSTKQKKSVKFSLSRLSSSFTTTMVQTDIPLVTSLTAGVSLETRGAPLPISNVQPSIDLCRELKESLANKRLSCLGIISDQSQTNTRSYSVFPSTSSSQNGNSWRIVSLKDSLESQSGQTPPTYRQRLRLAVFIARSALQFYKTPWLPEMPSNQDIFFFQDGSSSYFDRPFLMARSDKSEGKSKMTSEIQNPTLLAIGVLLIELLRGQTIESLRSPQEILEDGPLSLYTTASRLLTGVSQASSNYGTAVSRCIDGKIEGKDLNLENENDRHVIYCGVVSLLEEDLNNS